jgi:PAS domain S-box-containing protein
MRKNPINGTSMETNSVGDMSTPLSAQTFPESVWEAIFDSIPDLVTVIDKNCKIVKANKAMTERLGRTELSMIGMPCFESIHGILNPHNSCPHLQMLKDGKGHVAELYEPLLDGTFLVSTTPLFDQDGTIMGSVHIARDITDRKLAEDKLQVYSHELEELNTSKDKFFSVIAHDLKSPFQGLLGFTDILLEDFDLLQKEEIKNYVLNIRNASLNTYSLLENLLEWSRMQSGKMNFKPLQFKLANEVASVIDILNSNAIRKGISLTNLVDCKIEVRADQNMIHSVIQNLVSNAIKFSNSRGEVVVTSDIRQDNNPSRTPDSDSIKKFILINVQDHGIGIPPEAISRIFSLTDHFSLNGTANEPGTGLGLILSKEMIELHGGELSVTSVPGKGSSFSFTLPLPE